MLHNSFKFLSLALAASLTVAPVSAIDWNSNSTRLGFGLAVVGIAYIAYKWCFSAKNTPVQKQEQKSVATKENILDLNKNLESLQRNGSQVWLIDNINNMINKIQYSEEVENLVKEFISAKQDNKASILIKIKDKLNVLSISLRFGVTIEVAEALLAKNLKNKSTINQ